MSTITTATDANTAASALATAAGGTPKSSGDLQANFLKLLVTQLKNQDPLNPLDNAQITSQMAQISTVSGIDKLNTTLQSMATSFSADQSLQATSMIGRQVLVPGATLQLANGAAVGGALLAQAADKVVISVRDASGQVVHRVDLGAQQAGVMGFAWDGTTDSGAAAAAGSYSYTVEAVQGGTKVDATALTLGQVAGVAKDANGISLKLTGGGTVALGDVKQVM